jgi:hypothetical protein
MRFNAHFDTPYHGIPNPFKDARIVADSLIGIHSAMNCLFVVKRSCIHEGFHLSPQVKIQSIQVR